MRFGKHIFRTADCVKNAWRFQVVDYSHSVSALTDDTRIFQYGKMAGYAGLVDIDQLIQVAYAHVAPAECIHKYEPYRMRQGF